MFDNKAVRAPILLFWRFADPIWEWRTPRLPLAISIVKERKAGEGDGLGQL